MSRGRSAAPKAIQAVRMTLILPTSGNRASHLNNGSVQRSNAALAFAANGVWQLQPKASTAISNPPI